MMDLVRALRARDKCGAGQHLLLRQGGRGEGMHDNWVRAAILSLCITNHTYLMQVREREAN